MYEGGLEELAGLTALVETGQVEATGLVTRVEGDTVTVTCDHATWNGDEMSTVSVSVFAADALFRLTGPASVTGLEVQVGPGPKVERIQRRKWPRRRLALSATLCPVEDGRRLGGIPGRTIDVSIGGVCVETIREVDGEGNPMLILNLPDGTNIISLTTTVAVEDLGDGWRYRLAFQDLDAHDRGRLTELTQQPA
jgi:hypothetical protein